jgi:hypothetical protein
VSFGICRSVYTELPISVDFLLPDYGQNANHRECIKIHLNK